MNPKPGAIHSSGSHSEEARSGRGVVIGLALTFEQYCGFDSDECSADEFQRLWGRLERAQKRFWSDGHLGFFEPRSQVTIPPSAVGGSQIWLGGLETTWVWNGASWDLADEHTTSEVLRHGLVCMDDPISDDSVEEVAPTFGSVHTAGSCKATSRAGKSGAWTRARPVVQLTPRYGSVASRQLVADVRPGRVARCGFGVLRRSVLLRARRAAQPAACRTRAGPRPGFPRRRAPASGARSRSP